MKIANKKYVAAFFAVLLSLALAAIFVFQRHRQAPEQTQSHHEMSHHPMEAAEPTAHDTSQSSAYYQSESTRKMAERLRKLAEEANPETNIYANDKRVLYFKNKKRPPDLWGQLQIDALIATELLYAGQSEEAIQQFTRILAVLSESKYGFASNLIATTEEYLALSYLRLGEQENCTKILKV